MYWEYEALRPCVERQRSGRSRCCGGTVVLHQRLHFLLDALVPLGDVHVQRVVAAGLPVGPAAPLLKG